MDGTLRTDLQAALRTQELFTLYQPVTRVADGLMTSAEALARWPHRRLGMVSPTRFVPLAEQTGLIGGLTRFVLRDAVDQADWWNRHTPGDPLIVSVNTPVGLLGESGQIDQLEQIVVGNDGRTDQIMIELTGCRTDGPEGDVVRTITALRNRGFHVAVDDVSDCFVGDNRRGTVDAVKLDRSLVQQVGRSDEARCAVTQVVARAHEVGVTVIAKGVDGPRHFEAVAELGCDEVQGFGIATPGTARQVAELRWREMERSLRPVPA